METSNVRVVSYTDIAGVAPATMMPGDYLIAYTARVSNPSNQDNLDTAPKLIKYLIKNKHWSPFEMAHMTVEIETSRAIAQQILRHRSFSFQEFSQRYAEATEFIIYEARRQDEKNRQASIADMSSTDLEWFKSAQAEIHQEARKRYDEALRRGIAKEQARFMLPSGTKTRLYMCGSVRSWIHYIELRGGNGTQLEHQEIALKCKDVFKEYYPSVAEALEW